MFYSDVTRVWGFIAHIPLAIVFLLFISRQITLRDRGDSLSQTIFNEGNKKILNRVAIGCLFGLVLLGTLSPVSRLILS